MPDQQSDQPEVNDAVGTEQKTVDFSKVDYSKAQGARFYANHAQTAVTLFDIRLTFGDVDIGNEGVSAVQTVTILMTPELAVLTHNLLGRAVRQYELSYGKPRLPHVRLAPQQEENQEK